MFLGALRGVCEGSDDRQGDCFPSWCLERGEIARVPRAEADHSYSCPVLSMPWRFSARVVRVVVIGTLALILGAAPTAHAAQSTQDVVRGSTNYGRAVAALDDETVLWRPTYTAGLRRSGPIDVIAYGSAGKRATFAGSTYGKRVPSFTLAQKAAQTRWAAVPVEQDSAGLVKSERIRIGRPGATRVVRARIFANCRGADSSASDSASDSTVGAASRRCSRADVARFGGVAEVLARTTVSGEPRATTVRIDSNGLSYRQLVRVARGLVPVSD